MTSLLPHELTHIIFREFVGFSSNIPLWLDEGIACYYEEGKKRWREDLMREVVNEMIYIPLNVLTEMDVRYMMDLRIVELFYAQSASIVGYMIRKHGSYRFTLFCRQLRDGKALNEALSFTYPGTCRNVEKLERLWCEYILSRK